MMSREEVDEIDRVAERLKVTRTDVMRNMLRFGLDTYHDFEKIGLVRLGEIFIRVEDAIREKFPKIDERKTV